MTVHQPIVGRPVRVIIVGAGMSGILMAIRLRQVGIEDFVVYEKGEDVGGTWRENRYPGIHVDVPSQHYCYSFDPNPNWSKHFSPGNELFDYFRGAAKRFNITPFIRLKTAVEEARWDGAKWHVKLSTGETDSADILVSAAGILHVPVYPDIPGLETFSGPTFHTARWDESVSLADKRIGVIGTGSTGAQITQALAGNVKHYTLFQRTAQWVLKVPTFTISEKRKERLRRYPFLMRWMYDASLRQLIVLTKNAVMGRDPAARRALEENCETNLATVADPVLRKKLTPSYKAGCKRLVMSPNFYEAVQRPDTDVISEKIERVEPAGIRTADGKLHELDLLVLATGFDIHAYLKPMKLYGRGEVTLDDVWKSRPIAYHSITIPEMPNFFMLLGPLSPITILSVILVSEWQCDYIMQCIDIIRKDRVAISPTMEATSKLMARFREAAKDTIWAGTNCHNYYQDEEGVPAVYPYSPGEFRDETSAGPDLDNFVVEDLRALAN